MISPKGNESNATHEKEVKSKTLNKPSNSPWTSRAPLSTNRTAKNSNFASDNFTNRDASMNNINTFLCQKRNGVETPQDSSSQFFHFLRLMQLFPDVHPATLHTVMVMCRNDFFMAVDKLLYAKRCKDICNRRKFVCTTTNNSSKYRHQPYPHIAPNISTTENERIILRNNTNKEQEIKLNGEDVPFPTRSLDSPRLVYANKSKCKEKQSSDLKPVASPKCSIQPLSPTSSPQDLSIPQDESVLK